MTLLPIGYTRRDIATRDGRVVDVLLRGPADAVALVLHHGTPMSAAPLPAVDDAAVAAGFRVISCSRPGYGTSSERADRVVSDVVADVSEVLDRLEVPRFVTLGLAGGGPYALGCGALLPDRCAGVAAMSCVAPFDAAGLDWFAGMPERRVEELEVAVHDAPRYGQMLESQVARLLDAASPHQLVSAMPGELALPDRRAIVDDLADTLLANLQLAFLDGAGGWCADELALLRPWGFRLEEIRPPVTLWHGGADEVVPATHAHWLADRVPRASCRIVFDEGHWSLPVSVAGAAVNALARFAERQPAG
jgi:pimeloyl-ACP methyl ester carboxylesterase